MSNIRIKELKYNGKTYTRKFEIDEILIDNGLNWVLDCELENARIEIVKDTLVFNAGIFYNGIWEYGVFRDGDVRNITFQNGVIYNGTFKKCIIEKGIIFGGTFLKGDVLFADIRGGDFKDVNISNNVNQTTNTQTQQTQGIKSQPQTEPQVQGEIQGQAQTIQAQVKENFRVLKSFEKFKNNK